MRYWAYINGEVPGSFSPEQLAAAQGVSGTTLICPAEGEIDEKSWRRAGEFEEVARALAARDAAAAARPAVAAPTAVPAGELDEMLSSASTRLFGHVADLMKELESRREEKALVVSLQRQISALKDELAKTQERAAMLELRGSRLQELEDAAVRDQGAIQTLRSNLQSREKELNEARLALARAKNELEATRRRQAEAVNDLSVRNGLVDKLSKDLADKELALAKAMSVIRRLEEDLHRLLPGFVPAPPAEADREPGPAAPVHELSVPVAPPPEAAPLPAVTADEPPPAPGPLEPPRAADAAKPHQALAAFLQRFLPGRPH